MIRSLTTILAVAAAAASAGDIVHLGLTGPTATQGWVLVKDIVRFEPTPEGLLIESGGPDPHLVAPPLSGETSEPVWVVLRWKADGGGLFEVFWSRGGGFHPDRSARGHVRGSRWVESRLALPSWPAGTRLRIDPPDSFGRVVLSSIRITPRISFAMPPSSPAGPGPTGSTHRVQSGPTELLADTGGVCVRVAGMPFAAMDDHIWIAYRDRGRVRGFQRHEAATSRNIEREPDGLTRSVTANDPDGGHWTFVWRARAVPAGIDIVGETTCDAARQVVCLPLRLLRVGAGTFGERKALFCGLEYLNDEPSSSEADIEGPAAERRAPALHEITAPLMAVAAEGRALGLTWTSSPNTQPVFDSPDRVFGGGAHAMGLFALDTAADSLDESRPCSDPSLYLRAGAGSRFAHC